MPDRQRQPREREGSAATAGGRVTRSTRQAPAVSPRPAENQKQQTPTNSTPNSKKLSSLSRDPIPRRGAPVAKAFSVTNVSVRRGNDSEEGDDDDSEGEDGASEPEQAQTSSPERHDRDEEDDTDTQQQHVMLHFLPNLSRATDDLAVDLAKQNTASAIMPIILKTRRDDLVKYQGFFRSQEATSFLIDWEESPSLQRFIQTYPQAGNILAKSNIVSTIDHLQRIQTHGDSNRIDFLGTMDACFPRLLHAPEWQRKRPMMLLEIRTCYAIELLAQKAKSVDPQEIIARVFCQNVAGVDLNELLENGPYRELSGKEDQNDSERCRARVAEIRQRPRQRGRQALDKLRERFNLGQLLEELGVWLKEELVSLQEPASQHELEPADGASSQSSNVDAESQEIIRIGQSRPEQSMFHGRESIRQLEAMRSREDSAIPRAAPSQATNDAESQEIERIGQSRPEQSMFDGRESIRQLEAMRNRDSGILSRAPPRRPAADAPADYPQIPSSQILQNLPPASSAPVGRQGLKRARPAAPRDGDDDDDDDEEGADGSPAFEQDQRVFKAVKPDHQSWRPRNVNAAMRQSSSGPERTNAPSSSMPDPPASSATVVNPGPSSSMPPPPRPAAPPAMTVHRISRSPPPYRQRRPWSATDEDLLLILIAKYDARWSMIETKHKDEFEHRRDQQAYRDKARNIKVDKMLRDEALPPGFDKVVLGPKERARLEANGKNPHRREADVDDKGVPCNTEWDERLFS